MSTVHIGQIIKEVLIDKRVPPSEFATKIGMSPSAITRFFKQKEIRTDKLINISNILQHNFFQYYSNSLSDSVKNEPKTNSTLQQQIINLDKENQHLKTENDYLKQINKLLSEKKQ